jgi:hypothetical protein
MKFEIDVEVDQWLEGTNLVTALNDGIKQRQSIYDLVYESYAHLEEIEPTFEEIGELEELRVELEDALSFIKSFQETTV